MMFYVVSCASNRRATLFNIWSFRETSRMCIYNWEIVKRIIGNIWNTQKYNVTLQSPYFYLLIYFPTVCFNQIIIKYVILTFIVWSRSQIANYSFPLWLFLPVIITFLYLSSYFIQRLHAVDQFYYRRHSTSSVVLNSSIINVFLQATTLVYCVILML